MDTGSGFMKPATIVVADVPREFAQRLAVYPELTLVESTAERSDVEASCGRGESCLLFLSEELAFSSLRDIMSWLPGSNTLASVVVVAHSAKIPPIELLQLGCSGVLRVDAAPNELRRAVQAVLAGELWFSRKVVSNALRTLLLTNRLTPRELQIANLIAQGFNNQQIADTLFISRETVRWHVRTINAKTKTRARKPVVASPARARNRAAS